MTLKFKINLCFHCHYLAKERNQVMFTKRKHINAFYDNQLIMVFIKNSIIEYLWKKTKKKWKISQSSFILYYRITKQINCPIAIYRIYSPIDSLQTILSCQHFIWALNSYVNFIFSHLFALSIFSRFPVWLKYKLASRLNPICSKI